jgi:hypothetical protein
MNTISCGGSPVGHADATALWAADAVFAMAAAGVDGVNIHSYPGATYDLFRFRRIDGIWTGMVEPEYYGLLLLRRPRPPAPDSSQSRKHTPQTSEPGRPGPKAARHGCC